MGILSAIGAANIPGMIQDYQKNEGAIEAQKQAIETGKIQQDSMRLDQQMKNIELNKAKREEEIMETKFPLDLFKMYAGDNSQSKFMLDAISDKVETDPISGKQHVKFRDFVGFGKMLMSNMETQRAFLQAGYGDEVKKYEETKNELTGLLEKKNKMASEQKDTKSLDEKIQIISTNLNGLDKNLQLYTKKMIALGKEGPEKLGDIQGKELSLQMQEYKLDLTKQMMEYKRANDEATIAIKQQMADARDRMSMVTAQNANTAMMRALESQKQHGITNALNFGKFATSNIVAQIKAMRDSNVNGVTNLTPAEKKAKEGAYQQIQDAAASGDIMSALTAVQSNMKFLTKAESSYLSYQLQGIRNAVSNQITKSTGMDISTGVNPNDKRKVKEYLNFLQASGVSGQDTINSLSLATGLNTTQTKSLYQSIITGK